MSKKVQSFLPFFAQYPSILLQDENCTLNGIYFSRHLNYPLCHMPNHFASKYWFIDTILIYTLYNMLNHFASKYWFIDNKILIMCGLNNLAIFSLLHVHTVQLYLMQSSQKREAENFFLITTVQPLIKHCPIPRTPPAVWYNGSVS